VKQAVFILLMLVQSTLSYGHEFYQGLTRISYNPSTAKLEIIHRFTTHDLVTIISQIRGEKVSATQRKFPSWVIQYFNQHFSIRNGDTAVKLTMVGAEPGEETTVVYQIVEGQKHVSGLTITNDLLIDVFPKQINMLNYQDADTQGTLIFSKGGTENSIR